MNTGAEAVESAIKVARAWGYRVKGVAAGAREDHRRGRQLPRPHHDDHQLPDDPDARDDFGPYTPGFVIGALRRRRRARGRHRRRHRRGAARADPGRGRHRRAARRLPARACAADARAQRAVHRRRDPVGPRPHRRDVRVRPRRRRARPLPARQGARRRHRARLRRGRRPRRARRAAARASTARPSAATRSRPPSASRSCACSRPASYQERARELGAHLHDRLVRSSATASSRCAAPGSGLASTSTRRSRPAVRCARRSCARGVLVEGHPRLDDPASPRRSWSRPPTSTGPSTSSRRCSPSCADPRSGAVVQSSVTVIAPFDVRRSMVCSPSGSFATPRFSRPFDVSVDTR